MKFTAIAITGSVACAVYTVPSVMAHSVQDSSVGSKRAIVKTVPSRRVCKVRRWQPVGPWAKHYFHLVERYEVCGR